MRGNDIHLPKRLIVEGAKEQELDEYARGSQIPSLQDDAIDKLLAGVICLADLIESTRV